MTSAADVARDLLAAGPAATARSRPRPAFGVPLLGASADPGDDHLRAARDRSRVTARATAAISPCGFARTKAISRSRPTCPLPHMLACWRCLTASPPPGARCTLPSLSVTRKPATSTCRLPDLLPLPDHRAVDDGGHGAAAEGAAVPGGVAALREGAVRGRRSRPGPGRRW